MSQSMFLRDYPMSPEQRQAQRIATLERQVRDLQRAHVAAPQRIYAEALGNVQTKSLTYVALSGGPSVTVDIQPNQMVMIHSLVDCYNPAGGCSSHWGLYEATDFPSNVVAGDGQMLGYNDTNASWYYSQKPHVLANNARFYQWFNGTTNKPLFSLATALSYYPTPGTRTYEIRYAKQGDVTNFAQWQNRKLWVVVI